MEVEEVTNEKQNGYTRVVKYMGMLGGARGLSILLGIVKNKVAAKFLGTSGVGVIALCNRTLQMISDATGLGLSFSAVRSLSQSYNKSEEDVRHCVKIVRSMALLTGLLGMFLMLAVAPLVNEWSFDGDRSLLFRLILLSPVLLFMAVTNGEIAVMRGTQKLKKITVYTIWGAFPGLLVSVPLYLCIGFDGIFISIFLVAFIQMCIALSLSCSSYSYKVSPFSLSIIKEGVDIAKLGIGYMFVTMLNSLVMWVIYAMLANWGNDDVAGIFNAGLVMMMMLPDILFSAIDSEYYPRLASVIEDNRKTHHVVNEQIEVQLLVQSPLLMSFVSVLPVLVPLFYDTAFSPAIPMAQIAMFGMFMRTMTHPISYMTVSKNATLTYVILETVYNIILLLFVLFGYLLLGFVGVGLGIALAHTLDFFVVWLVNRVKYGLRLSNAVWRNFLLQMFLFISVILVSFYCDSHLLYVLLLTLLLLLSYAVSLKNLKRMALFGKIKSYFKNLRINER